MNLRTAVLGVLALIVAGCGGHGAAQFDGPPSGTYTAFGQCAFCHDPVAINMVVTAPDLKCQTCHADEEPGMVGPGHRCLPMVAGAPPPACDVQPVQFVPAFPTPGPAHQLHAEAPFGACAYCHNDNAVNMTTSGVSVQCTFCHDTALLPNYVAGHRNLPGPDQVQSFPGPAHKLGAEAVFGQCGFCHNETAVHMVPVSSDLNCAVCHEDLTPGDYGPGHEGLPGPEQVPSFVGPSHLPPPGEAPFGACAYCHNDKTMNMVPVSADLNCPVCHDNRTPGIYGPGHEALPGPERVPSFVGPSHLPAPPEASFGTCAYCHNDKAVNVAPVRADLNCSVCHDNRTPGSYGPGHEGLPGPERVPSFVGPEHLPPPAQDPFGACAYCHNDKAVNVAPVSAELNCSVCHDNRTPGIYGPGHEGLPGPERVPSFVGPSHLPPPAQDPFGTCAYCHNDKAVNMAPVSADLQCVVCHNDRQPGIYGPGHRGIPGPELVPSFVGPSHALGAEAGFGYCADCHNDKAVNMTSSGVSVPCTFCHATALSPDYGPEHRSLPGPTQVQSFPGPAHKLGAEAVYGQCGFCHNATAVTAVMSTGHGELSLVCENCHSALRPDEYGPGHESEPACAECHTEQHTHEDPAQGTVKECTNCHTPHGSTNIFLVNEQVRPPAATPRPVVFDNLMGLADGSFASVTQPGTGLCETCHTTTEFYRSDGTGRPHFPYPCFTCHPHDGGFAPD